MANADSRPTPAAPFLHFAPLVGMTPTQIAERLRAFGMHPRGSTDPGYHGQAATLTLRPDTTVDSALEALFSSFRQIGGIVDSLESNLDIPRDALGMIEAMHVLLQLAAGQFFVIDHAIREHQPGDDLGAKRAEWIEAARNLASEIACDLDSAAQLLGHSTGQTSSAVEASIGARAVIEAAGAKLDAMAGQQVRERALDWLMSPGSRKAWATIEDHARV